MSFLPRVYRPARYFQLALRVAICLGLASCAAVHPATSEGHPPGNRSSIALRDCTIASASGAVRCGTFAVPEDRSGGGRRVPLNIVVLGARHTPAAPDAIVLLAGGPGQGAAELAAGLAPSLEPLRSHRDVVLIDQRGTGGSNRLGCAGGMTSLASTTAVRECAESLAAHGDVRRYTTSEAVDDLEDVRAALGYEQWNLVGVSYGSRVAQVYMARYAGRTRTVTLRAVAPLGFNIVRDGERNAVRELDRSVSACMSDSSCGAAFPQLPAELDSVLARAGDVDARVRIKPPGVADSTELTLNRTLVAQTLYALLLSVPTRQRIPLIMHRAAWQGLGTLAPIASQVHAAMYGGIPVGMYLSVTCAEDVPFLTTRERETLADARTLISHGVVQACAAWPTAGSSSIPRAGVRWDGPALLLSGDVDPSTDAEGAGRLVKSWPRARHVVLPATSHGPMFPGCVATLVAQFIDRADAAGVDATCALSFEWPRFATPGG